MKVIASFFEENLCHRVLSLGVGIEKSRLGLDPVSNVDGHADETVIR